MGGIRILPNNAFCASIKGRVAGLHLVGDPAIQDNLPGLFSAQFASGHQDTLHQFSADLRL